MTDTPVAASETAFSRLNKPRRKVYGSVVEEEEEQLLTTSDFIDDGPMEAEKSLFAGNDMDENDDDGDELSVDFSDKDVEKQPDDAATDTADQEQDEEEQSSDGGDQGKASDEVLNTTEPPASEKPSDASVDEEAEDKADELSTGEEGDKENAPDDSSDTPSGRSKRVRKPTAPVDEPVEEKAPAPITDDLPSTQASEMLTQTTDEQPEEDTMIASVDTLFLHADKETVTVKDIVLALEIEFGVKLTKKTKVVVRERLKNLVQGTVEAAGAASEEESEEEESEEEENVEESEEEFEEEESSDFEEEIKKPKKPRKKKKVPSTKKASSIKEPRKSARRSAASKIKKPSAVRIHAEMLRKKRMDELRVRNEELQVQQNKEDQERAEQIAARFDTNTDELRMKRLEDRLDLLQKLDQKRIQVIAGDELEKVPIKAEMKQEVPSAASTSDSESDSDSDMELEIVGGEDPKQFAQLPTRTTIVNSVSISMKRNTVQSKALSVLDRVSSGQVKLEKGATAGAKKKVSWNETGGKATASPGKSLSARAALRSTLLSKQRKMGNLWLARELGYKSEQEHLRDCLQVEKQKRVIVIKKEEARLKNNERKQLRERMLLAEDEAVADAEPEEKEEAASTEAAASDATEAGEEEDEELAMAKAIENEEAEEKEMQQSSDSMADNNAVPGDDKSVAIEDSEDEGGDDDDDKTVAYAAPESDDITIGGDVETSKSIGPSLEGAEIQVDTSDSTNPSLSLPAENQQIVETDAAQKEVTDAVEESNEASPDATGKQTQEVPTDSKDDADEGETEFTEPAADASSNAEAPEQVEEGPKKAKNAGWQEMLRKEAQQLKKEKKRKGNGLVEAEADEEEEEDVVAGLEDFGFSMGMQKKDEEDEDDLGDELDEDDLKHVVDDISDDEGDEDAGEQARKELQKREEKEQHKEMMRRMREGYDGRRGGIAGGGVGARGLHRFDQLVAADNREDAKRLGLLNDDELDSDDDGEEKAFDGKDDAAEIDDETALLDKMLKDRFLHRSSVEIEEQFSDDEEEEVDQEGNKATKNDEDAEEREQELLAKRFAKRARMQRLIETHGEDEEFSQLRLIDEDQSMKKELMSMKDVVGVARRQKSASSESQGGSASNLGGDSQLGASSSSNSQGLFGSQASGSLFLALKTSKKRKNKTSFLGGSAANKEKASQVHKNVSLSHVVFSTENSQSRGGASAGASTAMLGKKKRKAVPSSSLWDKVAANSFRMTKKRY